MKNKDLQNNCFKFTEKILYGYKDIEDFIVNTEEKLNEMKLEENITTVGSINYDNIQVSNTFGISRVTEKKVLDRIEEETKLKIELYRNRKLKKEVDQAIFNLSPIHKDVIKYRYIQGLPWISIVDIMNYEERHLRNKKNEAIKSLAIKLFGIKVLEEDEYTLFNLIDL